MILGVGERPSAKAEKPKLPYQIDWPSPPADSRYHTRAVILEGKFAGAKILFHLDTNRDI